ncbi:MAG TPA: hypothetical protein VFM85_08580, partial [Actinomycetota bacterium]|nr:hypothetical protein [Actinomycetota bacterium]
LRTSSRGPAGLRLSTSFPVPEKAWKRAARYVAWKKLKGDRVKATRFPRGLLERANAFKEMWREFGKEGGR